MQLLDRLVPIEDWQHENNGRNGHHVDDAGPWSSCVRQLAQFQNLEDGWDGLEAQAPSQELLASAIGLAHLFHERRMPAPSRVVPGLEGEVLFEWQFPDGTHAEIEVVRPFFAEVMLLEPGKPAQHWTLPNA